jgi:hypothetical protein
MMNANILESSADAFLNVPLTLLTTPLTLFDVLLMILENPQTSNDTPLLSKASKVI